MTSWSAWIAQLKRPLSQRKTPSWNNCISITCRIRKFRDWRDRLFPFLIPVRQDTAVLTGRSIRFTGTWCGSAKTANPAPLLPPSNIVRLHDWTDAIILPNLINICLIRSCSIRERTSLIRHGTTWNRCSRKPRAIGPWRFQCPHKTTACGSWP